MIVVLTKSVVKERAARPKKQAIGGAKELAATIKAQRKNAMLRVVNAKVQQVWITRKGNVTVKRGPEEDKTVERTRRFRVVVGTYVAFDDGCSIVGPDGRVHTGRGTVARFNYRHQTWSVQPPQRCETNRVGYLFTPQGDPCWLKDERESGFTTREFEQSYSSHFVKVCKDSRERAEKSAAASATVSATAA